MKIAPREPPPRVSLLVPCTIIPDTTRLWNQLTAVRRHCIPLCPRMLPNTEVSDPELPPLKLLAPKQNGGDLANDHSKMMIVLLLYPPINEVVGGYIGFSPSVRPSVCPSVRLSRLPCLLCNIYSSGWILSILATNDHYYERMCRTQWPLTLTYIFKVIWPWHRVRSVASTVLDGFFLYLAQMITIIRGCVACKKSSESENLIFWQIFDKLWWPLTLTYIFNVVRPWLWKSCPLCDVFSSRSIISIFATNNHYH